MNAFISICGWEHFQHYKDRDPPWIKLYRDVLTTEAWVLGNDHTRLVQIASTLLAARYRNKIPLNFTLLRRVASIDMPDADFCACVAHLRTHKFLEIEGFAEDLLPDASNLLALCATTLSVLYSEQSRAEQSRAEKKARASTRVTGVETEADPPGLDADAAAKFIAYRIIRKPAIKPESMASFKRQLAQFGPQQAAVVENSIANGYQGLIVPSYGGNGAQKKPYVPSPTTEELEAREREKVAANGQN